MSLTTPDKITQNYRKAGMREIYNEAIGKIQEDLAKLHKRNPAFTTRTVSYEMFSSIIVNYFTILLTTIITKGTFFKMYQRMGNWMVVKTKCTRYLPKTYRWKTVDGKKVREEVKINVFKTGRYFYFMFWDSPGKWRHYRLRIAKRWKRLIWKEVQDGNDYLDYSMKKFGREASLTYQFV